MAFREKIAELLHNAVSEKKMSLHKAMKLFKPVALYSARQRSDAGRKTTKNLIEHLIDATAPGAKAAWTSVLFPTEILYLYGIYPLTLEVLGGTFATLGLSKRFLDVADATDIPPTMCSFHRILLGLSETEFLEKPECVAAASIMCDGNLKSFQEAAKNQDIPFFFLDVPHTMTGEGIHYLKGQLAKTMEVLGDIAGKKVGSDDLKAMVKRTNRSIELAREVYALQKSSEVNVFQGHELVNFAFPLHFLLGSERLNTLLEARVNAYRDGHNYNRYYRNLHTVKKAKRMMWMHIVPQYKSGIWDVIDDGEKAKVVCDEYSSPYFDEYDFQDPLGSIARRLIGHPSNGPIERRLNHILKIAKDFKVDGIIHYSSWGCHQAAGNIQLIGKAVAEAGYKFINLNGDAVDERNSSFEQHRTRLEAFLEQ